MKILLTGATGFLGSHLTKALLNEGYEVTILKRNFSNTWRIKDQLSKLSIFNIDKTSLPQVFSEEGPFDCIIHTATEYDRNCKNFSQLLLSNVAFPLQLLETAIANKSTFFINTDSFIHKNNCGYRELAGYALTKLQFLQWMKKFSSLEKIKFTNVKLEHVYGPLDSDNKFVPFVFKNCINNAPELNLTLGNQKRDFIYVDDVISAFLLLVKQKQEKLKWFKEYEVGTGSSIPVRQLVELIHSKTNSKTLLRFGALPHDENELMDSKANTIELLRMGWKHRINVERGIEMMIASDHEA